VFKAIPERFDTLAMPLCHFLPRREETGYFADRWVIRQTVSVKGRCVAHYLRLLVDDERGGVDHRPAAGDSPRR
jgi:hypothetical protein